MAPGFLLQSSLFTFLLLTSSICHRNRVPVYRLLEDTQNLEDVSDDWTKPDDGGDVGNARKEDLSDDLPLGEKEDRSSSKFDVSKFRPTADSSVYSDQQLTPSPPDVERLVNSNPEYRKLQEGNKPLTFPLNPNLRPQVASSDRILFWPFPQSPSHPYTNGHVPQSGFYPSLNAPYSWSPVLSNGFHGAGSQTGYFTPISTRGGDSTRPYLYNQNHFLYPLDNNYGGTFNKLWNYELKRSPTSYPANTQTVYVPEGQGQSFSQRKNVPVDYKPYEQMARESDIRSQPSLQSVRKPNPRYVIQSRNSYQKQRYFASKLSYNPEIN